MIKLIKWFFNSSEELIIDNIDLYSKIDKLENRIVKLEEENVELTNELYRLENSLDARIDILAEQFRINYNV